MRIKKTFYLFGLMLIMLLALSCVKSNNASITLLTPSKIPTTTASKTTFILPPTTVSTIAPINTPTISPTTIIKKATQSPSPTSTIIPTLSEESAHKKLIDLLVDNGGCRLPCLWGITPGKTSEFQAQNILAQFSGISDFSAFQSGIGTIQPYFVEDNMKILNRVAYLANDNILNHINFSSVVLEESVDRSLDIFNSTTFGKRLSFYMLPHILSDYGRPSTVLLSTLAKPPSLQRGGDTGEFKIILLYPDQGFAVQYTTNMHMQGQYVLGCPANSHVEFQLYSPDNGNSLVDLLPPSWQDGIKNQYKPIEEVTSMTTEEFYQTFREPSDNCIQTLASLWPVPEE